MSESRRQTCPNRCILTTQCVPTVCLSIGITIRTIELFLNVSHDNYVVAEFARIQPTGLPTHRNSGEFRDSRASLRGDAVDDGRDIRLIIRFLIRSVECQQLFSHATDFHGCRRFPAFQDQRSAAAIGNGDSRVPAD